MSWGIRLLVYGLFLVSGATALVYQVAWTRNLSLIFGASFEAISIVLGSFMAGLALGGVYFGRKTNRIRRPLRLYGLLEIGVAVFALALPLLLSLMNSIYVGLALRSEEVNWGITLARVVMAFGVLVLPTFFMGGTLPVLVRFLVHRYGELSGRLSWLYAINTLGAVIGAVTAGFVLLPELGVWRAQLVAIIGNVVVGLIAILADRRISTADEVGTAPSAAPTRPVATAREPAVTARPAYLWALRLAFWGTAVSGMCALALEVMWARGISIATGSTTYSFTIMLAAFLIGIALGSWIHAFAPLRRVQESVQFGTALVLIGISSLIVSQWIPRLPEYAVRLNMKFYGGLVGVRAGTTLLLSFLVMLVPCVFMGIAFPLAGQARARIKERFGESIGDLVGFNTVGAIAGSLLAGFVVIPFIGLQRGMVLASSIYLGYGLLVLCVMLGSHRTSWRLPSAVAAIASVALACVTPLLVPRWNMRLFAAFQNNNMSFFVDPDGQIDMNRLLDRTSVLYYREGRGSTVSVIETAGQRALLINGKSVATDGISDMQHEYLLGHLPTLLHPDPKTAVVIGLGAGLTLGGVAAEESLERIVVVEIEPAVFDAAMQFADLHDDALHDSRVEIVYQDGRNYLLTTPEKFDVITADPIHPWAQGAAYLYTTEYYGMIADHLADGGVMCQWLPLYELNEEHLKCVVASFAENFAHTTLWQATGDAVLIGSNSPVGVDLANLAARMEQPGAARQLARTGLADPLSFLAEFTMDQEGIERFARDAIINTDDNLYLEFSSPLTIGTGISGENTLVIDSYRSNPAAMVGNVQPLFGTRAEAEARLDQYRRAKSGTIHATLDWGKAAGTDSIEVWTSVIDRFRSIAEAVPEYGRATHLLSECLSQFGLMRLRLNDAWHAMALFREALQVDAGNATANYYLANDLIRSGEAEQAVAHYRAALQRRPHFPEAAQNLGMVLARLTRFEQAVTILTEAARQNPDSPEVHHTLGFCLIRLGRLDEALLHYRAAHDLNPDDLRVLEEYTDALYSARRHRDACLALRAGLERNPGQADLSLRLAWVLATSPDDTVRDGSRAVDLARSATEGSTDPRGLDILAAALAEAGRFEEAVEVAERAATLAVNRRDATLAQEIRRRQSLYEQRRPYRP
ncbi:MAG: fused MFS/spermidine synthase [Phycisphaerales bacterium]|nr:MAG: fused MFS/spermidine synthase [Phycisphaerales bacterium]